MSRQGSQMSKYVKKRRAPPAEETWGNQGSVESFSGEEADGLSNRRFVLHLEWCLFVEMGREQSGRESLGEVLGIYTWKQGEGSMNEQYVDWTKDWKLLIVSGGGEGGG